MAKLARTDVLGRNGWGLLFKCDPDSGLLQDAFLVGRPSGLDPGPRRFGDGHASRFVSLRGVILG